MENWYDAPPSTSYMHKQAPVNINASGNLSGLGGNALIRLSDKLNAQIAFSYSPKYHNGNISAIKAEYQPDRNKTFYGGFRKGRMNDDIYNVGARWRF